MKQKTVDLSTITDRVLLVDDDPDLLKLLGLYTASYGLESDQVKNGKEALERLQDRPYGLVITDIIMPEMDGMALLQHINRHYPQLDVLVISSYSDLYSFVDLIAAGATDFISKPFGQDELQAKIQRIFRERQLIAQLADSREKEKTFFLNIVESLAISLDEKDRYTHGHSRRVTNYSLQLAEYATEEDVDFELLRLCGILHDIGKIGVPDNILTKPGRLLAEEYDFIKKHPGCWCQNFTADAIR